jgi:SMI1 / KNR4 family (SUKH-1)
VISLRSTSDSKIFLDGARTMNPIEIIRDAQTRELIDEDDEPIKLELLPGLGDTEMEEFQRRLPCSLPEEIIALLRFARGFEGIGADVVNFTGRGMMIANEIVFPHGLPIASDGYGNFWVVDLSPESTKFGPIWFACHDAPVILYQSSDLADFLTELFKLCRPPHKSLVDDVHEDGIRNVWRSNPGVLLYEECRASSDEVLRDFAAGLDRSFQVIDLRDARPGDGFSWGRYGPRTVIKRYGLHPVFAYQKKAG